MKTTSKTSKNNSWTSFFSRKVNALIGKSSRIATIESRLEIVEQTIIKDLKKTIKEGEKVMAENKKISPVMKQANPKKQSTKTKTKTLVKKKPIVALKNAGMINCALTTTNNVILTGFDMALIDSSMIDGLFISDPYCNKCKSNSCDDSKHKSYQKAFVNKSNGTETTKELLKRSLVIAKEIRQQAKSVKGITLKIGGGFS